MSEAYQTASAASRAIFFGQRGSDKEVFAIRVGPSTPDELDSTSSLRENRQAKPGGDCRMELFGQRLAYVIVLAFYFTW